MPGRVPGIHVFRGPSASKTWMAGTSPAMTEIDFSDRRDGLICRAEQAMKTICRPTRWPNWGSGDVIDLKVEAGCLRATRSMTKHDHAMAFARRAFKRYRKAFEILAKS
jgi:hypothetical protein